GHGDFQSPALPTELSGQRSALNRNRAFSSTLFQEKLFNCLSLRQSVRFHRENAQIFQTIPGRAAMLMTTGGQYGKRLA
ncbi:hypothetical protein, partial [Enterobacter bugandensis]|uniref:hypothetical protein n=1 Tax=Enterobacter bugandensis TaxID=881260 RepID=UPI0021D0B84B